MAYIKLLKNVPLDNSYSNPILFSDAVVPDGMVKVTYDNFFSKYGDNGVWMPSVNDLHMNIRVGDGINTTIIVPDAQWQPSYNYAIIRFTENEIKPCQFQVDGSGRVNQPFFYFITNCVPLGKGGYVLTLELDVMTTYFSHIKLDHQIFTERKHCNRWKQLDNTFTLDSRDAILGDNIDTMFKATKIKDTIRPIYNYIKNINNVHCSSNYSFEELNRFISGYWVYLFYTQLPAPLYDVIGQKQYFENARDNMLKATTDVHSLRLNGKYNTSLYCVAIPLETLVLRKYIDGSTSSYDYSTIGDKFSDVTGFVDDIHSLFEYPSLVGAKLSTKSPFVNVNYKSGDYGLGWNNALDKPYIYFNPQVNTIYDYLDSGMGVGYHIFGNIAIVSYGKKQGSSFSQYMEYILVQDLPTSYLESEDNNTNLPNINLQDLINSYKVNKNISYEPKLYTQPYNYYKLTSQFGGEYNYSPLLIGTSFKVGVYCELTPEPDKIYYNIEPTSSYFTFGSPYRYFKQTNTGVTTINDNNIPYSVDAYKQYLASHRASVITSLAVPVFSGIAQSALSFVGTSKMSNKEKSAGSILVETGGEVVDYIANQIDLLKTPDTIKNMGNNPIHDYIMDNFNQPYIVEYELFDNEKQQVFDFFYDYGYRVNRKCYINVKDFTNREQIITRQKFNYVKIKDNIINEIEFLEENPRGNITYYVPQIVKQKINSILNKGCKLWTLIYKNQTGASWQDFYLGSDFENAEIYMPD